MYLWKALNLIFVLDLVRSHQNWDSTQQLAYETGNEEKSQVFIHFDNQTLEMRGNKDLFKCVKIVKQMTLHCIDSIAIQWKIKAIFLKALQMNETEAEETFNKMDEMSATNAKQLTEEELEQMVSSQQLICCILSELFDCMEYSISKECNYRAYQELKQIHGLIATESYNCKRGERTQFCDKMLRERKLSEKEPESTSGEKVESFQLLLIMFHIIVFFVFIK